MATFLYYTSLSLLLFVAVLLILLVLIQKGRGGGLSSAFGGSGGSTAFGAKTGDVLTWATSIVFGVFIVLAVVLDLVVNHQYATPVTVESTPAAETASTAAIPAPVSGPDQVQQTLDRMARAATQPVATTVPTTQAIPALPAAPHVEPTTVPTLGGAKVPVLTAPATTVPATRPH